MADGLATLARLRRLEEAEARRILGQAAAREAEAARMAEDARAARWRELASASSDGMLLAALAAWLPRSDRAIAEAEAEAGSRRSDREDAASALRARRAALRAVETLTDARQTVQRRHRERRLQSRLDEVGQRIGGGEGGLL